MKGHIYGVEAWGDYQLAQWWLLAAGFDMQHENLSFKPRSSALGGVATAGDDPNHQATLRSTLNMGSAVTWEADFRWIGKLPNPEIPSYAELNTQLNWKLSPTLETSIAGLNLFQARHLEYEETGATLGDEVERSCYIETRWKF